MHVVQALSAEQMGLAAGQVVLVAQPTQAPVAEHMVRVGSASAPHWALVVQAPHAPAEQIGDVAGHAAPDRQATHLFALVSQTGVVPEQWLFAVHCTQVPKVEQIGAATGQVALV